MNEFIWWMMNVDFDRFDPSIVFYGFTNQFMRYKKGFVYVSNNHCISSSSNEYEFPKQIQKKIEKKTIQKC